MLRLGRLLPWGVVCSLLLFGARASADEQSGREGNPVEQNLEEAKRLFREGNELRKLGDCERALDLYLRSRALVPSMPNTINAAFCLNELGRYDEALELYETLMVGFSQELSEEDRTSLAPVMSALRARVATLEISANSSGILVIDARPRGRLPLLTPVRVLPGRRTLRVISDGWETFERTLVLKAGETTRVFARLKPLRYRGNLRVESSAETTVFVDGAPVGPAPWQGALAPGRHVYFVRGETHGSAPTVTNVIEGQTVRERAQILPLGPEFRVRVEPRSAEISIDGVMLNSGSWQGRLPRGVHTFEAREIGYRTVAVRVDPADRREIAVELPVDPAHPRWGRSERPMVRLEGLIGIGFGPGLGSGAESSCASYSCPENDPALGVVGALRLAYELSTNVAVEATLGYFAFRTAITRNIASSFEPEDGAAPVFTRYQLEDELLLLGPFAALGGSYRWPLYEDLSFTLGGHVGGWVVSGSDDVGGSISAEGQTLALDVEGSGVPTRSTDVFVMLDGRLGTRIAGVWLSAGFAITTFLLEGPRGALRDVHPAPRSCSSDRIVGCAPGERFVRDRGESTHGPFIAIGPYASAAHRF